LVFALDLVLYFPFVNFFPSLETMHTFGLAHAACQNLSGFLNAIKTFPFRSSIISAQNAHAFFGSHCFLYNSVFSRPQLRKTDLSSLRIISPDFIPHDFTGKLALGLLASGGSGFWNSILTYVTKAKDIKAAEAESKQMEGRVKRATHSKPAR